MSAKALRVRRHDGRLTWSTRRVYRVGGAPLTRSQTVMAAALSLAPAWRWPPIDWPRQLWRFDGDPDRTDRGHRPPASTSAADAASSSMSRGICGRRTSATSEPSPSPRRHARSSTSAPSCTRTDSSRPSTTASAVAWWIWTTWLIGFARSPGPGVGASGRSVRFSRSAWAWPCPRPTPSRTALSGWRRPRVCPRPICQHPVDLGDTTVYLDLAWPEVKLAVECDGLAHHFAAHQLRWDDRRQNALVLLGWMVLRFTWADVTQRVDDSRSLLRRAWRDRTNQQVWR